MTTKKVSFWRIFWPSLLAGIVLILLAFILFTSAIGSLMNFKKTYEVKDKSILHIQLKDAIGEMSKSNFSISGLGVSTQIGLADITYGLETAAEDNNIKGVFIELDGANCGFATATAIRDAITKFKEESGKFVVAYHRGEAVTLRQYYIASAASENYGFPTSSFEFLGLGTELMFFKGLFDKLDLEMQVIRGENNDFKSAVEPYYLTEMSDSSRLQIETYLDNIWGSIKEKISQDRGVSVSRLDELADNASIRRMKDAVDHKLVDDLMYKDEILQLLADKVEIKDPKKLNLTSFEKYAQTKFDENQKLAHAKKANVAVIIAEGAITVSGDGIASDRLTKQIRKARKDEDIKTIVFRINSGGGSALASEEIWREVKLANEEKEVIVSMGDVAASGGYYIAAPSKKIFAERNTITGSIGVFGAIPYTGRMLEEKLGLTFDRVGTNQFSVISLNKKFSEDEFEMIQSEVNSIYSLFLERVAEGRNMSTEAVNRVARGRVWTGDDALRLGLVDELGGIQDAIAYAIKEADIADPVIRYYPKSEKEIWMELIEQFDDSGDSKTEIIPAELVDFYQNMKKIEEISGIQARLPYEIFW